jgi:hypothetical protein
MLRIDQRLNVFGFAAAFAVAPAPAHPESESPPPASWPSGRSGSTPRKFGKPSSAAFCARSCASRAMVARVSLASPRSARFQEFSKIAWRVARSLSKRQIGLLRGVLQRHHQPCCLRAFAASAAAAICASLSPASAALSVVEYAPALVAASSLVHERVLERRLLFVELLQLWPCRRRRGSRRPSQTAGSRTPPAAAIRDRDERRALVVDRLDARKQFGVQVNRVLVRGQRGAS